MLLPLLLYALVFPDSILAQAATEAGPWLTLVNLGVGGIFLWAYATGKVHSDKELQRVIDHCDAERQRVIAKLDFAEAELRERNREARDMLVPTLTKALVVLGRFVDRQSDTPPPKGRQ